MPLVTLTQRLLTPPSNNAWTVQMVAIPVHGLEHPQAQRVDLPSHDGSANGSAGVTLSMPATRFQPRDWSDAMALLICGAGDNRHAFKGTLIRKLLERGIGVLTVDPPGHGDFMACPTTVNNVRLAARAASDWLHAQPGVTCVGAIGISFGGNQAAALAAEDERIAALVLISTPVRLNLVTRWTIARETLGLCLPRNLYLMRHVSFRQVWAEWKSMKGAWFGESLYDMIERLNTPEAIQKMGARPTLFVHGRMDAAIPSSNARQLYEAATPEREIILAPQGTHLSVVMFDKEMAQMADWLATRLRDAHQRNLIARYA